MIFRKIAGGAVQRKRKNQMADVEERRKEKEKVREKAGKFGETRLELKRLALN